MEKLAYQDPPPAWTEVIIMWEDVLNAPHYPIREILNWIDSAPGQRYHLHGHKGTEGFVFRFENPKDATYFRLKWL
jgi:hypothetical protein